MRRISVVGNSGSGKTTVARAIAGALGVPHLELDAVFHQPDWQPLDTAEFRRIVGFTDVHQRRRLGGRRQLPPRQ